MNTYRLQFLDQTYEIKSDKDEEYLKRLFHLLESKVKELKEKFPYLDFSELIFFGSLNLIEELIDNSEKKEKILKERLDLLIEKMANNKGSR
ncbi:MAG: cell division protein ZapA [candidate division WOR-3 bacterium]|nr:cell division protein ZapA [candidate division WOR-3 bacterium]MCX7836353.1 cell division protein ZapA [candidate division WOR-3 bacterium]MDW8113542.1 cell division protein ZapA [candidate division WOR-3 bacterium]